MSVVPHQHLRKSCPGRYKRESHSARKRSDRYSFGAFWSDSVALASLAVIIGIVVYLVICR
jgi:hypothetical protein